MLGMNGSNQAHQCIIDCHSQRCLGLVNPMLAHNAASAIIFIVRGESYLELSKWVWLLSSTFLYLRLIAYTVLIVNISILKRFFS